MAEPQHIVHSIPPTFDERSRVLVLGTMPSPASRAGGYNYGHPQNRFWRVLAHVAHEPLPTTNERKRDFCLRHHIALWDVLAECDIAGASDASITNAVPNRLTDITHAAPIEAVFCTGAKAYELYNRYCAADVGIPAVKLPSTSPANAACRMERLVTEYAAIFAHTHEFTPPTLDVPDVVALEQTIAATGTPLSELMDRAGTAVAHRVRRILEKLAADGYPLNRDGASTPRLALPDSPHDAPLVTILCGNGNNGGDGWVVARLLAEAGVPLCVITTKLPAAITAQPAHDAAVAALDVLRAHGAQVLEPTGQQPSADAASGAAPLVIVDDGTGSQRDAVRNAIARAHVVVDALMGTGSARNPRAPFDEWITSANESRANHVQLAVDVPSGIDAQTGAHATPRFLADETITMIVAKPGLSASGCGRITVASLAYIEPFLAR